MTERTTPSQTVSPLAGALPPQCRRDLDSLRRFVHTATRREPQSDPVSPAHFREVLLTGATGFIGRFFLRDLLRQKSDLVVHCLVRADNVEHGLQRLREALQQAEIRDESLEPRIRVVIGDMAEARFGLSEAGFDSLCRRIDAVYHLAADLTLASPYAAIRKINTFGVRSVLELCLRTRTKHLFYASTMGVFPQYFCAFAREFAGSRIEHQAQPDLADMKRIFPLGLLGYPWSKLVAEQSLLHAQRAGLPVAIFRLPRIGQASTGFAQANDITVRIFSSVVDVEMMPPGFTIQHSNEAVDTLSEIATAISLNPRRRFTIYHCCNPQLSLHELEPADFGLYWPEVSYGSFKRACQGRGEDSPLQGHWALVDHFAPYWFSDDKSTTSLPVCDRALREDCPIPVRWPGLITMAKSYSVWTRRHRQQWPHPVPQSRLDFDCLISRAELYAERAGVAFEEAFPQWVRSGLRQMVQAIKAPESGVLDDKLGTVIYDFSRLLRSRADLAREWCQYPEIGQEPVTSPVFIVGINRTGTTYLHRLMSRDKRFWVLRLHELGDPVLSVPEYATVAGTLNDPRRDRTEEMLKASEIVKAFEGVHDFNIDEPEEDFPIFRMAFAAWVSTVRFHVPAFGRWLAGCGFGNAYAFHRRVIQHFSWQRRIRQPEFRGQWLFKMPFHLLELESLIETYPDALFIQTHREPEKFMGSWNSLVARVRSIDSEPRPDHELGAEQLTFMSGMMDKAVRFRETHPELEHRWMDVNYVDLVEDPLAVVHGIYERFNWPLKRSSICTMDDWLFRQGERRRKERRHRYNLKDYGLTQEDVNAAFSGYREFLSRRGIRRSSR